VVFGRNGAGKSLLLRAIRDADPEQRHYILPERLGAISSNLTHTQQQRSGTQRANRATQNFSTDYRTDVFSKIDLYLMRRGNIREERIPGDPAELEQLLSEFLPDFQLTIQGEEPPFQVTRIATGEAVQRVESLSSGEAEYLTIGLDVVLQAGLWTLEGRTAPILLVDEPDEHLHPDLQQRFGQFLVRAVEHFGIQVVVATHSTTLLSALGHHGGDRTSVLYLTAGAECSGQQFDDILEELTACLGGHVLMGALFGAPLLLVEGDDDMRIWSQVPRHGVVQLGVIPCKGEQIKQHRWTLEQIFQAIKSPDEAPVGFALFDGDKNPPQLTADKPQDFLPAVQLNCHEAENLYVTAEVLAAIGIDWAAAVQALAEAAPRFGEKAPLFADVDQWDRRGHDLKPIINEIARTIDPKGLHWTVRVGKAIGAARPSGELEDYLGEPLVTGVWGPAPEPPPVDEETDKEADQGSAT
jgi:ABC-type lipoprotein export system ATPase subunit